MNNIEKEFVKGLVSVITPVYNAEKVIGATLESIFAQTYKNIEIVLVDDCSSDNSEAVIANYMKDHPEIVYFRQPINQGAGSARNKALELARGQYVAFLDSDDLWLPEKTEKQLICLKSFDGFFSYTGAFVFDGDFKKHKKVRRVKNKCSYRTLLKNTMIITSSVLIDRSKSGDFRMSTIRSGQDYATWLQLLRANKIANGICEPLCKYRIRDGSLSSNKFKSIKQVFDVQTKQEGVCKFSAFFNTIAFIFNALKKRIF